MFIELVGTALAISLISVVGVFFFGDTGRLTGVQRFAVPIAVGVFLSLVLYELIPETLALSPEYGGIAVAFGFISFYILANILHKKLHEKYQHLEEDECDRKGAALLLLIGDAIHNTADGVVLGGAFLISPTAGFATAFALALHELPQEIVEFGVLIRAGYSRGKAALLNLISASTIFLGAILIFFIAEHAEAYIWIVTGIAAGNLLFLAASDLLPRIHGNLKHYKSIWHTSAAIMFGFVLMTTILNWSHSFIAHNHDHADEYTDELHDEHVEENNDNEEDEH